MTAATTQRLSSAGDGTGELGDVCFVDSLSTLFQIAIFGFLVLAGVSLWQRRWPTTPPFARPRTTGSGTAQLRRDSNATFVYDRGFLFRKRWFFVATGCPPFRVARERKDRMRAEQLDSPVSVVSSTERTWWWFENVFYWESGGYSQQDVLALVRDKQRREKAQLDRAHLMLNVEQQPRRREAIPREIRRQVFERDGGTCIQCGAAFDIQYDHVIPVSMGGSSTADNLQLLCGQCNRTKGANL